MSCPRTLSVRVKAVGFMAQCESCSRWCYAKLAWQDRERAMDLRCPLCGGRCEADLETLAGEVEVEKTVQIWA